MKEEEVKTLFNRYERLFNEALRGHASLDEVAGLYTSDFLAASPAGVMPGKNGDELKHAMADGYARYREIGTKEMALRSIRVTHLDGQHCVAHASWTAVYARSSDQDVAIDFEVHYFVQSLSDGPKVFGWVSGDEQALLKAHGII